MTFSIIGIDKNKGEIGVANCSRFIAVGSLAPAAKLNIGAISTQALANVRYKEKGLELMKKFKPEDVIKKLIFKDKQKERRQAILMNVKGESAGFTGKENMNYAGHTKGENCIVAGNRLKGEEVIKKTAEKFSKTKGGLGFRLIEALKDGLKAGGDIGKFKFYSCSLLVIKKQGGLLGLDERHIDLRVDMAKNPLEELKRLYKMRKSKFIDQFFSKKSL